MKKIIALALTLVMAFSFGACAKKSANTVEKDKSETSTTQAEKKATPITLGDAIDTGFVKITADQFEIKDKYDFEYKEDHFTRKSSLEPSSSSLELVCLRGKLTNMTTGEIYPDNVIKGKGIINGNEYTLKVDCYNVDDAEHIFNVVSQMETDVFIYAEVPSTVADSIETCEFDFGFNENLDSSNYIDDIKDCDYLYSLSAIPSK